MTTLSVDALNPCLNVLRANNNKMKVVKTCKVHGDLPESKCKIMPAGKRNPKPYFVCRECNLATARRWYAANKERCQKKEKEWRDNNRERINKKNREWKATKQTKLSKRKMVEFKRRWHKSDRLINPEKYKARGAAYRLKDPLDSRIRVRLSRHKITRSQYEFLVHSHNNLCGICKQPQTQKSRTKGNVTELAIDHCHDTGMIRGLLCHNCNTGLGHFRDSPELLQEAIKYLLKMSIKSKL